MPSNAYLAISSLSGTRPDSVPADVRGYRREDPQDRCPTCVHHRGVVGRGYAGQSCMADICLLYRRELLVAKPTTRPCLGFTPSPPSPAPSGSTASCLTRPGRPAGRPSRATAPGARR